MAPIPPAPDGKIPVVKAARRIRKKPARKVLTDAPKEKSRKSKLIAVAKLAKKVALAESEAIKSKKLARDNSKKEKKDTQ